MIIKAQTDYAYKCAIKAQTDYAYILCAAYYMHIISIIFSVFAFLRLFLLFI